MTYNIFWKGSGTPTEQIDTAETKGERDHMIREYTMAYNGRVWSRLK